MLDFGKFAVLTFDCYGTMIDWESGIFSAVRPILKAHGKELSDAELLQLYAELELQAEQKEYLAYRDVLNFVVRGLGKKLGFSPTDTEARSLADSIPRWQPFSDTVGALQKLKTRYKLAVISNIDDDLFAQTAPKLGVQFDAVTTAQQA